MTLSNGTMLLSDEIMHQHKRMRAFHSLPKPVSEAIVFHCLEKTLDQILWITDYYTQCIIRQNNSSVWRTNSKKSDKFLVALEYGDYDWWLLWLWLWWQWCDYTVTPYIHMSLDNHINIYIQAFNLVMRLQLTLNGVIFDNYSLQCIFFIET